MPLSGRALAEAYVVVRADMSAVAGDVQRGTQQAVDRGARSASRRLKDAIVQPVREGFAEGARAADPGGAAVGGRFRQGLVGRLRGIGTDTQRAGADAGAGIDRGISGKMRDVAATTTTAGQRAGEGFTRGAERATTRGGGLLTRAVHSTAGQMLGAFGAAEIGMNAIHLFAGFVADARESAKIGALTEQVIRSTGGAARVTAADVSALATAVSNKTGVDDEAIQAGENLLLTFTNVRNEAGRGNDVFNQATSIMADMSVALGQDMSSSAIQLGKALNDPIKGVTALQRAGVSFTAQQRAQIKTLVESGRTLDAQKIILAELGREFGGAAAAAATPVDRLRVIAGNLGEQIGTALIPAIDRAATILADDVVPAVSTAVTWLSKVPAPVYGGVAAMVALWAAMRVGKSVFGGVSGMVKDLGAAMQWMGLRTVEATAAEGLQTAAAGRQSAAADVAAASTTRLGAAMGVLAKGAGVIGLAAVAVQLAEWSGGATTAKVNTDDLTASLTELGQTGRTEGAALDVFKQGWGPFSQDVHNSGQAITTFGELAKGALGGANESFLDFIGRAQSGSDRMGHLTDITRQYDASLSAMVQGGSAAQAKAVFDQLAASAQRQGVSIDEIRKLFPGYTAAVAAAGTASTAAAGGAGQLNAAQRALAAATGTANAAQQTATTTLGTLVGQYPKYKDQILAAVGATTAAAGDTAVLTQRQVAAATAAVMHQRALEGLVDALTASKNATLQLRGGEAAYEAALDAATDAARTNGRTLDVHTAKGRANRAALDSLASSGLEYLGVIQKNNGVGPVFRRTLDQQWRKLFEAARRFGATREEARKYADQIYKTPKSLATKVTTPGLAAATAGVRGLHSAINNLSNRALKITVNSDGTFTQGTRRGRAAGGPIPGQSPTPTADNIPIAATAGEHMWSVAEVRGAGGHGQVERLRQMARTGTLPRFAAGGSITVRGSAKLPSARTLNAVIDADMMEAYKRAYNAGGAGGPGGPVPKGPGVARWGPMVHRALARLGLAQSLWDNWMRQIATESGGNPHAINLWDSNARAGHPSQGLLQTIPGTFNAYHVPGTSWNIQDGWANMLAAMNYAAHRYRGRMEAVIGHGHGYAAGTRSADPGWGWVGENGRELVRFRGGEDVRTATESRALGSRAAGDLVRLHPDTVAAVGAIISAAMTRQAVVIDGRTVAGYVDRALGRASLSARG